MADWKFDEWVEYGASRGWVSLPICETHTGLPLMPEEEMELDDGYDPCLLAMRVWVDNIIDDYE